MSPFTFNTVPSLIVGSGSIARLGEIAAQRLGPRVALVTDAGLVKAGLVAPALQALEEAGIAVDVFDGVVADPPEDVVLAAVARARAFEARAVIGFGGGSSIDVAKLVALLASSGENLPEIYGVGIAKGPRLPLLAIPTTAGTGSEVTPISIVTTGAHEKKGVVSPLIIPDIALLDPDLTLGLPPHVTAATGIDAMVHAIEAYTSTSANNNPVSQALAKEALRLLGRNIERAVHHGKDPEARSAMLLGSHARGAGLRQFARGGRACAGLSDRRAFRHSARALQRARAAACAALQRECLRRILRGACAFCLSGARRPRHGLGLRRGAGGSLHEGRAAAASARCRHSERTRWR